MMKSITIKPESPLVVKFATWLMLLHGAIILIFVFLLVLLGIFTKGKELLSTPGFVSSIVSFIVMTLIALIFIIISFGLRRMRKWSLYAFTAVTIIKLIMIYNSYVNLSLDLISVIETALQSIVLIFLLPAYKKFI